MIYKERFTITGVGYGYTWHLTDDEEAAYGFTSNLESAQEQIDAWIADGEEFMGIDDEPDYDAPTFSERVSEASDLDRSLRW